MGETYSEYESYYRKRKRKRVSANSRLNKIVKILLFHFIILSAFIGLALIAFGMYLIFADWGSLEPGFFRAAGIITSLFGIIIVTISHMGIQGVFQQNQQYGFWTGRKIIFCFQFILTIIIGCELYFLNSSLWTARQFKVASSSITTSTSIPYISVEKQIANTFNSLYFSAIDGCGQSNQVYAFLWKWINSNCPSTISADNCQVCAPYSITMCQADLKTCREDSDRTTNFACPYNICRRELLSYVVTQILPISVGALVFLSFQGLIYLLTIMLACYTPRDSVQIILAKSGLVMTHSHSTKPNPQKANNELAHKNGSSGTIRKRNNHPGSSESDEDLENPSEDDEKDSVDEKKVDDTNAQKTDRKSQRAAFLRGILNLSPQRMDKNSSRLELDRPVHRTTAHNNDYDDGIRASMSAEVQYDAIYAGIKTTEAISFGSNMKNTTHKHTPHNQPDRSQHPSSVSSNHSNGTSAMRAMQFGRNNSPSTVQSGRGRGAHR